MTCFIVKLNLNSDWAFILLVVQILDWIMVGSELLKFIFPWENNVLELLTVGSMNSHLWTIGQSIGKLLIVGSMNSHLNRWLNCWSWLEIYATIFVKRWVDISTDYHVLSIDEALAKFSCLCLDIIYRNSGLMIGKALVIWLFKIPTVQYDKMWFLDWNRKREKSYRPYEPK